MYQVNRETDLATDVVIAMTFGAGAAAELCVMAIHKDNLLAAAVLSDVTPPGAATPRSRTLLADLDGNADHCPGLVNADGGPAALRYWAGQLTGSRCTLKAAASATGDPLPPISEASPGAAVIGRIPVEPAVPFVVGDALVLGDGVYALIPGLASYQALYRTTRTLARVASADLDGDGAVDAVIAAQGEAGLDVLMRSISPPGFQLLRLDTASEATTLTLGDYDGNGIADIAYTEAVGSHQRLIDLVRHRRSPARPGRGRRVLRASWGSRAFSSPTRSIGCRWPPTSRCCSPGPRDSDAHAASRQPESHHDAVLRSAIDGGGRRSGVFRGTVIGRFGAPTGGGATTAHPSLVAFAGALGPADGSAAARAFTVAGTDTGLDAAPSSGAAVTGLFDCAGGGSASSASATPRCSRGRARPATTSSWRSTTQAVPHAGVFDPAASPITVAPVPALSSKIPANSGVVALHAVDLDGDGAVELVAAFAPGAAADRGAILICRVDGGVPVELRRRRAGDHRRGPRHARVPRRRAGPPRLSRSVRRAVTGQRSRRLVRRRWLDAVPRAARPGRLP